MKAETPYRRTASAPRTLAYFLRGGFAFFFAVSSLLFRELSPYALTLWAGAALIIDGVAALFVDRAAEPRGRGWVFFSGVAGIVFGVAAFLNPVATVPALAILVGVWAILLGALEIYGAFELSRARALTTDVLGFLQGLGALSLALGAICLLRNPQTAGSLLNLFAFSAFLIGFLSVGLGFCGQKEMDSARESTENRAA